MTPVTLQRNGSALVAAPVHGDPRPTISSLLTPIPLTGGLP